MTSRTPRLVGYSYVADGTSADVDAQVAELERALGEELWDVLRENPEREDTLEARSELRRALWLIADGQADGLAVTHLERLTTSIIDLGDLLEWLRDANARLVALDLELDTGKPAGRKVAGALMHVSEWPRRLTSERTKAGMAAARAHGRPTGRPSVSPDIAERIRAMRDAGMSLRNIAAQLNDEGIPTARGAAKWQVSAIQRALGYERPGAAKRRARRRPELPPLPGD